MDATKDSERSDISFICFFEVLIARAFAELSVVAERVENES